LGGVFGTLGHIINKKATERRKKEGKVVMVNDVIKEIKQNEKERKALEKEKAKMAKKDAKLIEKNEKREEKLAKKANQNK
ncbi:MAG: hypothetical protein K2P32_00785, partial [Clostridia bacterium]|nr:hypothetical protein [Clostridia bacterium]